MYKGLSTADRHVIHSGTGREVHTVGLASTSSVSSNNSAAPSPLQLKITDYSGTYVRTVLEATNDDSSSSNAIPTPVGYVFSDLSPSIAAVVGGIGRAAQEYRRGSVPVGKDFGCVWIWSLSRSFVGGDSGSRRATGMASNRQCYSWSTHFSGVSSALVSFLKMIVTSIVVRE